VTKYTVTNNARGPRMIVTPAGGRTIPVGGSIVADLDDNTLKANQPRVDLGELTFTEGGEDGAEVAPLVSLNATPSSDGAETPLVTNAIGGTDDASDISPDDPDNIQTSPLTHVEHKGFGRYYGMSGDEKITEAMTRQEAEAFAAENNVPVGAEPDPGEQYIASAGDETDGQEPASETSPPDET